MSSDEPNEKKRKVDDAVVDEAKAKALGDAVYETLEAGGNETFDKLISTHGQEAVEQWRGGGKHQHSILHELVRRDMRSELEHVVKKYKYDLNVQRASDNCTPLHLSAWTKKAELMKLLLELGSDPALKNKYGEDCNQCIAAAANVDNIVWLDLELKYLPGTADYSPDDSILECAVVITNKDLVMLAEGSWIVHHEEASLAGLSDFHQKTFVSNADGGNGLFEDVIKSTTTKAEMEAELLQLLEKHCEKNNCRLGGNSVHCDREVLLLSMPSIYEFCSHQIIDVSTVVNMLKFWNPTLAASMPPATGYNHRAASDIRESIAALKWLRDHAVFVPTK